MVEEADAEAIGELAERLFAALERLTGWRSQEARSATLEVVKDGSGIAVYIKSRASTPAATSGRPRVAETLPDDVAAPVESVFRRLEAASGDWTLTFHATDGHLRKYRREESGSRPELGRFDAPPLRLRGC